MLAALADGQSTISGYLSGADCLSTLACLAALGVPVRRTSEATGELVQIDGRGLRGLLPRQLPWTQEIPAPPCA